MIVTGSGPPSSRNLAKCNLATHYLATLAVATLAIATHYSATLAVATLAKACMAPRIRTYSSTMWLFLLWSIAAPSSNLSAQEPQLVPIRVVVSIPKAADGPNHSQPVYLAGSLPVLGSWAPDGLLLERQSDGTYQGTFQVRPATVVQFKVTQGRWANVERDADGRDISNRQIVAQPQPEGQPQRIEIQVARWASDVTAIQSTVVGNLSRHEFRSEKLGNSRTVFVWLPPDYDRSNDRYPVLFLQDGQNLFDCATAAFGNEWQVDETATELIEKGEIRPLIIIGVGNTADRIDEYTMTHDARMNAGGAGRLYIAFLTDELKPWIDKRYRTEVAREATWIGGSSLGGLISLHACLERPDVFSGCLAFSPSLAWDRERIFDDIAATNPWPVNIKLWLSMGSVEGGSEESQIANTGRTARLAKLLESQGVQPDVNLWYRSIENARHDELSWAKQFPEAIKRISYPVP
jgi:predicted alpha/beta superfamily hydrolase